jgi:hypothetical protein
VPGVGDVINVAYGYYKGGTYEIGFGLFLFLSEKVFIHTEDRKYHVIYINWF